MSLNVRYSWFRTVDPTKAPPYDDQIEIAALSMWRMALAASQETLQTGLLTKAWLRLFTDQLSQTDQFWLRWQDMGNSAEIRRAQSALYGRYLARASLGARTSARFFVPLLRDKTILSNGVYVSRTSGGDIPDWLAWNGTAGGYILGEAKGVSSPDASLFHGGIPKCIVNGKAQFDRVGLYDRTGAALASTNWVVANLWATDQKAHDPHIVMWDPAGDGRSLTDDELPNFREGIARVWLASMARGFGRPRFLRIRGRDGQVDPGPLFRIEAPPSAVSAPDEYPPVRDRSEEVPIVRDTPSKRPHEGVYSIATVAASGVRPLNSQQEVDTVRRQRPSLLVALDRVAIEKPGTLGEDWLGDAGIVSSDGYALFDLRKIRIEPV